MSDDYKIIRVTMDVDFMVPMHSGAQSQINGWTPEEVLRYWFERNDINAYHAGRDSCEIGGSKKIKSVVILEKDEL